ncbi:MAG: signal recognition particle-docking protein FtsY [Parvularculaceae bacterium]|nr:signal recognition particle-docking protein FtsY [Parvularculaceae bacterium]
MSKGFFSNLFGRKKKDSDAVDVAPEAERQEDAERAASPPPAAETAPPVEPAEEAPPAAPIAAPAADLAAEAPEEKRGFFSRLRDGLSRSANKLTEGVTAIFTKKKLDDATIEELEELLISADLGVAASARVATTLAKDRFNKEVTDADVKAALASTVAAILEPLAKPLTIAPERRPHVILVAGVNGSGKTTTIGKLAQKFRNDGRSVMLAAGDTFRAAAIDQLRVWGERAGAVVVSRDAGADAAGLAFDALEQARREGIDVLLIDTAGRLQNRRELMDELAKIVRVVKKQDDTAPHDVLLVLDATVGQNALSQAEIFRQIAGVTGLVMTKLDGTAKGGVLVALGERFQLPIHYIGVGEGADDLQPFDAGAFARALAGLGPLS